MNITQFMAAFVAGRMTAEGYDVSLEAGPNWCYHVIGYVGAREGVRVIAKGTKLYASCQPDQTAELARIMSQTRPAALSFARKLLNTPQGG
jgi:hypothetical protein